jgi:hypothetical protein
LNRSGSARSRPSDEGPYAISTGWSFVPIGARVPSWHAVHALEGVVRRSGFAARPAHVPACC